MAICLGIYPIFHGKWMKWMDHFHWKCFTRCPTPTERWPSPQPITSDLKDIEHWNQWTFIWKISGCWSDSFILYNTVYIYMYIYNYIRSISSWKNSVSSSPNLANFWHSWLTKRYNTMQSTDSWFQKFENWIARSNHLWSRSLKPPFFALDPDPSRPKVVYDHFQAYPHFILWYHRKWQSHRAQWRTADLVDLVDLVFIPSISGWFLKNSSKWMGQIL